MTSPIDRLPLALVRLIPVVVLFVEVTLVNVIPSVVGLTTRAGPPVDTIEPVVTFTVPLLVADTPVPLLVVTASDENENVPLLEFRFTPVPLVEPLFTVVPPKLKLVPAGELYVTDLHPVTTLTLTVEGAGAIELCAPRA
jgi:hypothetical protein